MHARIVLRIKDSGLQERLLRESNLNVEKSIEIVQAAEASREQIRNMKYATVTINFMKENQNKPKTHSKNIHENELVYIDSVNENETKCAMKNSTDSNFKNAEMVSETSWNKNVSLDVNNKCFDVNFKMDTGAEKNILPLNIFSMFRVHPKLSKTNISLTTYGNFNLKPNGSLIINCSTDELKNVRLPFYVVNVKSKPILGLRGCKELKLIERINAIECSISKNELIKQYTDVFTGVGEFPNEPYHITLKYNAVPVIHPPRRVPLALQPKLKSTLDRLEKEGIVQKLISQLIGCKVQSL
ncbi:transposon Ty3-I Gag-Pol polyprotein [Trichonephila clavipes]|nr:transposon Ty3-I Gag-Pol polyprotein [Trichonephila clavipes]